MRNTVKKPPEYIRCAMEVLAMPDIRARDDFTALKKGLPVLAAKLFQSNVAVTTEILLDAAHRGSESVKNTARDLTIEAERNYSKTRDDLRRSENQKSLEPIDLETADIDDLWKYVEACGDLAAFKKLENRDPEHAPIVRKTLLYKCARHGYIQTFNYLMGSFQRSAEIDQEIMSRAAMAGQLDIIKIFHGMAKHMPKTDQKALRLASGEGHLNVVKYLVNRGVNIHADNGAALDSAVCGGHLDVIKHLQEQGAEIHQNNYEGFRQAAMSNHFEILKYFVEQGADIHADSNSAISNADMALGIQIIDYLAEKGADTSWMNEAQSQKLSQYRDFRKISGGLPPICYADVDPYLFRGANVQKCYAVLSDGLRQEGYATIHGSKMAFQAAVLFGDDQIALRYLEKFGTAGKQPLHDVIYMIDFPKGEKLDTIEWDAWRGAIMAHGPKMAQFFKFADKVSPVRSACGKNWSYYETLDAVAVHGYARADEHPELAALFMRLAMDEGDFEDALSLTKAFNCKARKTDIPDISFDLPNGHKYMRLPQGDIRGLVLGKFTDCCQSLNGAGDTCARHGFISNDSGFYVVLDKKGEIIGQSWAWLSHDNIMVLDSLETLGQRIDAREWTDVVQTLAKEVEKSAPNIAGLHVGQGGKTPKMNFGEHSVKPKSYLGYRDSHTQYQVWKRKV